MAAFVLKTPAGIAVGTATCTMCLFVPVVVEILLSAVVLLETADEQGIGELLLSAALKLAQVLLLITPSPECFEHFALSAEFELLTGVDKDDGRQPVPIE